MKFVRLRDALVWSMMLLLGIGCSKDLQSVSTSGDGLAGNRLKACVEGLRVRDLIPKQEKKKEAVRFDYSPAAIDGVGCDGIYYYATIFKPVRPELHRDQGHNQQLKYYIVIILGGKVYPLATKSEKYRRRFFERKKSFLTDVFGDSLVTRLSPSILSGYRRIN